MKAIKGSAPRTYNFLVRVKKSARYFPDHFRSMRWPYRFAVLLLVSLWLVQKSDAFIRKILTPLFKQIGSPDLSDYNKIQSLVFFDLLVCIIIAAAVLFLASLIFGRPDHPGRLLLFFRNRPYLAVLILPVLVLFMISAPKTLGDLLLTFSWATSPFKNMEAVHPVYYHAAKTAAICVGLSVVDVAFRAGTTRYWAYLILFAPFSAYPLLWWNAVSWIFPSRYWVLWRPVLAAATCVVPVLVFPLAQPIRNDIVDEGHKPVRLGLAKQELSCLEGYMMRLTPEQDEVYIRCDLASRLTRFDRKDSGQWAMGGEYISGYYWKSAAFDFENDRGFFINRNQMTLEILRLTDTTLIASVALAPQIFPHLQEQYHLDYHSITGQVAIVDESGFVAVFDPDQMQFTAARHITPTEKAIVWETFFDKPGERIFVLGDKQLWVLSSKDLHSLFTLSFSENAVGGYYYQNKNEILISFPEPAKVLILDAETLRKKTILDAPLGVRSITVDNQRKALFFGAMTGMVEMRDDTNYRVLQRARFSPWIHGLEAVSRHGELLVSFAVFNPVVWTYDPRKKYFSLFDFALETFEWAYQKSPSRRDIVLNIKRTGPDQTNDWTGYPEHILILSRSPYYKRLEEPPPEIAPKIVIRVAESEKDFRRMIKDSGECFDLIYINDDEEFDYNRLNLLRNWAEENVIRCRVQREKKTR